MFRGTAAGACFHAYCRKSHNATDLLPPSFIEIFISNIVASKVSVIVTNIQRTNFHFSLSVLMTGS